MFGFKRIDYKETLLRSVFVLCLTGLILGISMNKILIALKLKELENGESLVSLEIDTPQFPVWPSFMCGKNLTRMTAQAINRANSQAIDLPDLPGYITETTTESIASGNWTKDYSVWPCFVFNAKGALNFKTGDVDQITLSAWSDRVPISPNPDSLLFGIFDKQRTMSSVDPFVSPSPSENTYTFTRYQKTDINNTLSSYFFVNKQNTVPATDPIEGLVAKFTYSPDTYLVISYIEKRKYTPYDLVSAVGGLITYAVAAWVIMFGRGKYRSWGLVQRYLLRSSPNAKKNDNDDSHEGPSDIENQINNKNHVGTPATTNFSSSMGNKSPRSTYYFSTSGIPTTNFTYPLFAPSSSLQSQDLIKSIDALINQKLWFVEQTLNRHYLAGFRIRKYDTDKLGLGNIDETLIPPTAHHNWNSDPPPLPPPKPLSYYGSQNFKESNSSRNSLNSLNPEEQRPQYPNVSLNQIPFEKKHREESNESGNYQHLPVSKNTNFTGIAASKYDGNYFSNMSMPTPLSPYSTNTPTQLQSDSNNSNPIPSSSLQVSVISNSQEIQGSQQQSDSSSNSVPIPSSQMSVGNNSQEIQGIQGSQQ